MLNKIASVLPAFRSLGPTSSFYELVMDQSPNMIFVKDDAFRFVYANRAVCRLFAPEEQDRILGYTRTEDFTEEERSIFQQEDRLAFAHGASEIIEEITDYTGESHIFLTRKTRFYGPAGEALILGISTDITELSKREKSLVESNKMLEHFAALAAHDLRSPLCTFISCGELITLDEQTQLSPQSREMLGMMDESARHLTKHIALLLETYKAQRPTPAKRHTQDMNLLLEQVKFNLSHAIETNGARIYSSRLPSLKIESGRIRQLFHNLIENSLKYRGEDAPVVVIRHEEREGEAFFAFEDNGLGIPEASRDHVFGLGSQLNGENSGAGFGLNLCRRIVEDHGGRIWVDGNTPIGCRICFLLPRVA